MILRDFQTGVADWSQLPAVEHPGTSGTSTTQARQLGEVQLRRILYSPGYLSDHWCRKGHIILVTEGDLILEYQHSHAVTLGPGQVYCIADDDGPAHRARCEHGATILVID